MKSSYFYYDPNAHYTIQDTPLPFDSSLVKRKFLNTPCATLSFSQNLVIYLPDEGDRPFPVIAAIHRGVFFGWDKGDMQVAPMQQGLIENAVHLDSAFESNENIDKRSIHKTVLK